jgi:hypothetical protein
MQIILRCFLRFRSVMRLLSKPQSIYFNTHTLLDQIYIVAGLNCLTISNGEWQYDFMNVILVFLIPFHIKKIWTSLPFQSVFFFNFRTVYLSPTLDWSVISPFCGRICLLLKSSYYLSCLPICLLHLSAWLPFFFWLGNWILGTIIKNCWENPNLVKTGSKYWALYMKT